MQVSGRCRIGVGLPFRFWPTPVRRMLSHTVSSLRWLPYRLVGLHSVLYRTHITPGCTFTSSRSVRRMALNKLPHFTFGLRKSKVIVKTKLAHGASEDLYPLSHLSKSGEARSRYRSKSSGNLKTQLSSGQADVVPIVSPRRWNTQESQFQHVRPGKSSLGYEGK